MFRSTKEDASWYYTPWANSLCTTNTQPTGGHRCQYFHAVLEFFPRRFNSRKSISALMILCWWFILTTGAALKSSNIEATGNHPIRPGTRNRRSDNRRIRMKHLGRTAPRIRRRWQQRCRRSAMNKPGANSSASSLVRRSCLHPRESRFSETIASVSNDKPPNSHRMHGTERFMICSLSAARGSL